jgi:hypothetical protein
MVSNWVADTHFRRYGEGLQGLLVHFPSGLAVSWASPVIVAEEDVYVLILKIEDAAENLKIIISSSPNYALSNHATLSPAQIGAAVPLIN